MKKFEAEIFADRCALYFGKPYALRDATIDAGLRSVQSEAYALGRSVAVGLRDIAKEVLKNPMDYQDFFEGLQDHISD